MGRTDIPFFADDSHAFLPWIIGIMACLAALLLCMGLSIGGWVIDRHEAYSNNFTVNIPAGSADNGTLDKVRAMLTATPGVTGVAPVSESHLRDVLKPWLGDGAGISDLPLPSVFDVTVDTRVAMDYAAVQSRLEAVAPGTEVDAHERWVASFAKFSAAIQALVGGLAAIIVVSLALMVAFTSRASLKLHARTVQLLHTIGAEDGYIARQFQREAFLITLLGALPGALVAGIIYGAAGWFMASLQAAMLPPVALTRPHLALLLLLPLLCGAVAWMAARLSVIRQLQRVL